MLEKIRVPRLGPGRPRKKPDSVAADKAYSNGPCREYLRRRGIGTRSRRRPTAGRPAYARDREADGHRPSTRSGIRNATPSNGPSTDSRTPGPLRPVTTSAATSSWAP
ncbi:hypothetical protein [Streptomyces sp. NBC_00048]|uniref:hypothetical protein n=1 Tax=Streptomyces sp. NBC_00048 TaxID=2975628 RepID=UPI003867ACC8